MSAAAIAGQGPFSAFFSERELTRTSQLVPNGYQQVLRYGRIHTVEQIREDLQRTARSILDPLAARWGKGVISSGYRGPEVNKLVGGSSNSAHSVGLAADWQPTAPFEDVIAWAAAQVVEALPFDRIIFERRGKTRWLHIQATTRDGRPARIFFHSPSAGVYLLVTPEQLATIAVAARLLPLPSR